MLIYIYLKFRYMLYDGFRWAGGCVSGDPRGIEALVSEEVAKEIRGLGFQHAARDGESVVEAGVFGDIVEGSGVAGLRAGGGVDEA